MAVAGHIVANLTANTTGWSSGLRGAIGPLQAVAGVITGMAVGAVSRFVQVGDELDKLRARTGISATELSKLGFAASQSDVSMAGLQSGLTKMGVFLRDTAMGSTQAKQTLSGLGIQMDQLNAADAVGKFGMFADALNGVQDPGERAAIAMKIFGKGAIELLPLLNEGSTGLARFAEEAERLGLVMDDETAASAAKLGDQWAKMKSTADRLLVTLGAELAPVITLVSSVTATWLAENRDTLVTLSKVAVALAGMVLLIKAVTFATQAYSTARKIALALSGPAGWLTLAGAGVALGVATWGMNAAFEAANAKLDEASTLVDRASESQSRHKSAMEASTAAAKEFNATLAQMKSSYEASLPKSEQLRTSIRKMGEDWHAALKAGAEMTLTWDQMKALQTRTQLNESGFTSTFETLKSELAVLRGEITETEQQFAAMASFGVDDKHISALRTMMAERDAIVSQQQQEEREAEEQRSRLADTTRRVMESQETPLSRFEEDVKAVSEAIRAGEIHAADGLAYLEQQRQKMLAAESTAESTAAGRGQASNTGLDARGAQANQMIVDLVNRRGAASPEAAALAEQKKNTALASKSATLLTEIRDDNRRQQRLATRPFGQRPAA